MKAEDEMREDIINYIEWRKWCSEKVANRPAPDEDLKKLEICRDLAVQARQAGWRYRRLSNVVLGVIYR